MSKKLILVALSALTLGLISAWTIANDEAPPAPAPSDTAPTPNLVYRCSYTDGGINGEEPKGVYAVNLPNESSTSAVTDLYTIANVYLSYDAQDYVTVQLQTSPADPNEPAKLMAEGQFSTLGGFSLAAIKDGVKAGTLACGYVEAETAPAAGN